MGRKSRSGSAGRVAAGALSVGNTIGAAIANRRILGPAEAKIMVCAGVVLLIIAALAALWPLLLIVPFTLGAVWLSVALLIQAYRLHRAAHGYPHHPTHEADKTR
jgi:cardiolipin synthase A/B